MNQLLRVERAWNQHGVHLKFLLLPTHKGRQGKAVGKRRTEVEVQCVDADFFFVYHDLNGPVASAKTETMIKQTRRDKCYSRQSHRQTDIEQFMAFGSRGSRRRHCA